MDDFVTSNLQESKNEWCSRLVSIFTPLVFEGVKSIFNEAWKMCLDSDEPSKYLMTFQNLLSRIPKWNLIIIEEERKRIIERSGCQYLEELISCVHIIQLKVLTCIRVGNKQKQIDISIPKLDNFIHKVYIHVARKLYINIYLYEKNITPLQAQKNNREIEMIIQECVLTTIRESIPTEDIIRAYMDESVEHEEEVTIEQSTEPIMEKNEDTEDEKKDQVKINDQEEKKTHSEEDEDPVMGIKDKDDEEVTTRLKFNDFDSVLDGMDSIGTVNAPKSLERLEEISTSNALQRKLDEEKEESEDRIKIHTDEDSIDLGSLNFIDMDNEVNTNDDKDLDRSFLDIEELNV